MKDHVTEATISAALLHKAAIAQKLAVSGGVSAVVGGFTVNHVAAIGGIVVGVAGLAVQIYYKRKADRRAEELHKLRVQHRLLHPYEDDSDG